MPRTVPLFRSFYDGGKNTLFFQYDSQKNAKRWKSLILAVLYDRF